MNRECLSVAQIRALLAGELAGLVEEQAILHLESCPHCERVAAELTEDPQTRQLAQARRKSSSTVAWNPGELENLRMRLLAYGLYQQAEADAAGPHAASAGDPPRDAAADPLQAIAEPAAPSKPSTLSGASAPTTVAKDDLSLCGRRLGPLEISKVLGSGTFGVVFEAYDHALKRRVALKVARPAVLADPALRTRFFREAQALARLDHPGIVPVYGAEEIEGVCYLVLAFCPGPTLQQYLSQRSAPLLPRQAVALVLPLVEAVGHAHQRGILHRDIKPGNILLGCDEGESADVLRPRLTDFGLAKLIEDKSSDTLAGLVMGTATYMAPEQAAGHRERIGPASDLYALGVVLYELLTGRLPIQGSSTLETLRQLMIQTPSPPSDHQPRIDRDLDAIVLKCLAKSPDHRYLSAEALADDLRRWLAGQPVQARPRGWLHRAWQPLVRYRRALLLVTLLLAMLGLGGALFWMARVNRQLQHQSDQAHKQRELAQRRAAGQATRLAEQAYAAALVAASEAAQAGEYADTVRYLAEQRAAPEASEVRGFEWHYLEALTTRPPTGECVTSTELYQMALFPSGRELAAVGKDGSLRRFDAATLKLQAVWPTGQGEVNGVDVAPDGRSIATAGDDGTICLFDATTGQRRLEISACRGKAFGVRFYDQGRKLASCGEEPTIRLWEAASGQPLGQLEKHAAGRRVEMLAISGDGRYLASAGGDTWVVVWDLHTHQAVATLKGHARTVSAVAFSPDGRQLVSGSLDQSIRVWEVPSGRLLASATLLHPVHAVAVVAGGSVVLTGDQAGCVRRFRLSRTPPDAPEAILTPDLDHIRWHAHQGRVWSLCPALAADAWYTTGADGHLRAWRADALPGVQRTLAAPQEQPFQDLVYTPDGKELLVLDARSGLTVYDAEALRPLRHQGAAPTDWRSLHLLPGRDEVAAGNAHGVVAIWNYRHSGPPRHIIDLDAKSLVRDLAYDPATQQLVVLPFHLEEVRVYPVQDGTLVRRIATGNHWAMALAPDGRHLAVDLPSGLATFELATGRRVRQTTGHVGSLYGIAYSPDGRLLAATGADRRLHLWTVDGSPRSVLAQRQAEGQQVVFSADGRRLLVADEQGKIQVVDMATRQTLLSLTLPCDRLLRIALAPNQRQLATIVERDQQRLLIVLGPTGLPGVVR